MTDDWLRNAVLDGLTEEEFSVLAIVEVCLVASIVESLMNEVEVPRAAKQQEKAANRHPYAPKFGEKKNQTASAKFLDLNARISKGCADHA